MAEPRLNPAPHKTQYAGIGGFFARAWDDWFSQVYDFLKRHTHGPSAPIISDPDNNDNPTVPDNDTSTSAQINHFALSNIGVKKHTTLDRRYNANVYVSDHGTLTAALAFIGSTDKSLTVDIDCDLGGASVSIPSNISHFDVINGAVISNGTVTFAAGVFVDAMPEWFGAVGDGVTDDATAFGMLSTAMATSGGVVRLDNKTYLISSSFNVPSNTTVIGVGSATIKGASTTTWSPNGIVNIFNGKSNIRLQDFIVDGNKQNNPLGSAHCFKIAVDCHNIHLENLVGKNAPGQTYAGQSMGDGLLVSSFYSGASSISQHKICTNVTVINCTFTDNTRQGCSVVGGKNITFYGCKFSNTAGGDPGSGVDIEPGAELYEICENVKFDSCEFYNNHYGFQFYFAQGGLNQNIALVNSKIHNNRFDGILFQQCSQGGVVVDNCDIYSNHRHGVRFSGSTSSPIVRNCRIRNNSYDGIHYDVNAFGAIITGNDVSLNGGHGVYVDYMGGEGHKGTISDNAIYNNGFIELLGTAAYDGIHFVGNGTHNKFTHIISGNRIGNFAQAYGRSPFRYFILEFEAAGYVACDAADVGRQVYTDTLSGLYDNVNEDACILRAYDNAARQWIVEELPLSHIDYAGSGGLEAPFADGDALVIWSFSDIYPRAYGTGSGTLISASAVLAYEPPDQTQRYGIRLETNTNGPIICDNYFVNSITDEISIATGASCTDINNHYTESVVLQNPVWMYPRRTSGDGYTADALIHNSDVSVNPTLEISPSTEADRSVAKVLYNPEALPDGGTGVGGATLSAYDYDTSENRPIVIGGRTIRLTTSDAGDVVSGNSTVRVRIDQDGKITIPTTDVISYGALSTVAVSAAGTNYVVGDIVDVDSGTGGSVIVTEIDGGGGVTAISVRDTGSGYTTGVKTTTGGSGAAFSVNVTAIQVTAALRVDGDIYSAKDISTASGKGYKIDNAATAKTYLRGNGTRFVESSLISSDMVHTVTRVTSGPHTITADMDNIYYDTDGGAITANLPAGTSGRKYSIRNNGTSGNNITLNPNGSDKLFGVNSAFTIYDGEVFDMVYEPTEGWF